MKAKVYFRIGLHKKGYGVHASIKPNNEPLSILRSYSGARIYQPTVAFAINFEIPDELFKQAERVIAEVVVGLNQANVAAEVSIPSATKANIER